MDVTQLKTAALDKALKNECHVATSVIMNHDRSARLRCECTKLVNFMFYIESQFYDERFDKISWVNTYSVTENEAVIFLRGVGLLYTLE